MLGSRSRTRRSRSGLTIDPDKSEAQTEFSMRVQKALAAMKQAEEKLPPVI